LCTTSSGCKTELLVPHEKCNILDDNVQD